MTCRQATRVGSAPRDHYDAAANSLGCWDLAISELRKRLLEQRAEDERLRAAAECGQA